MYGHPQQHGAILGKRTHPLMRARINRIARPVLSVLAGALICITTITIFCLADRLATPAVAAEVSGG